MGGVVGDADAPHALQGHGVHRRGVVGQLGGDGGVVGRTVSSGGVPAGPDLGQGGLTGGHGSHDVVLVQGAAQGVQVQVLLHGGLELGSVNGGVVVLIHDPAAVDNQVGQEVGQDVVGAAAADQETVLVGVGRLGLLGDVHQIREGVDILGGVAGVRQQLLVVHHDRHVAVVGSQVDVLAHLADGGGGGNDVVVKAVSHLAEVGQYTVLSELGHPGAVHHAQVVGANFVDGIQGDAGVQVVEGHEHHFDVHVVLRFKGGQAGLQGLAVGAAPQDQGHLGGLAGSAALAAFIGRVLSTAAAGRQRQRHGQRQDQGKQFFHFVSSYSFPLDVVSGIGSAMYFVTL